MQAKIADKFTVLRSMYQTAGGHPAGTLQMLSGDPDTRDKPMPRLPDWMSVAHYLRSQEGLRTNALPNYTSVNPINASYCGPAYLGDAFAAFSAHYLLIKANSIRPRIKSHFAFRSTRLKPNPPPVLPLHSRVLCFGLLRLPNLSF
jgi:hypothetical protein